MVLSSPDGKVHYVSVEAPGSYHDSTIFKNSALFRKLFHEKWLPFPGAMILGDAAYVRNYWFLVTPLLQAQLIDERTELFNQCICASRSCVECCFGQLKMRFFILKGGMRFINMKKCSYTIQALCAIHNFIKRCNNPADDFVQPEDVQPANVETPLAEDEQNYDLNTRQATNQILLAKYF